MLTKYTTPEASVALQLAQQSRCIIANVVVVFFFFFRTMQFIMVAMVALVELMSECLCGNTAVFRLSY